MSGVDEKRAGYDLKAPGAGASSLHLPGRADFPRLDDHLVVPEVTRDEVIKGRRVVAMPAAPPHGDQHFRLDYVVAAHVAPGYEGSTDLLTRMGKKSDFATDACIRKTGTDPATGTRYLEEIAFEVVSRGRGASASGLPRAGAGYPSMLAPGSRTLVWWCRWRCRLCSMPRRPTTRWWRH
jgi:hypothetical protein